MTKTTFKNPQTFITFFEQWKHISFKFCKPIK